jgi:hypothetical protein
MIVIRTTGRLLQSIISDHPPSMDRGSWHQGRRVQTSSGPLWLSSMRSVVNHASREHVTRRETSCLWRSETSHIKLDRIYQITRPWGSDALHDFNCQTHVLHYSLMHYSPAQTSTAALPHLPWEPVRNTQNIAHFGILQNLNSSHTLPSNPWLTITPQLCTACR